MERKFVVLRVVSSIFKVLAWIILAIGILSGCLTLAVGAMPGLLGGGSGGTNVVSSQVGAFGLIGGIAGALAIIFFTLLYFLFVFAFGDLLNLLISLEENTRLTAERLAGSAAAEISSGQRT